MSSIFKVWSFKFTAD